MPKGSDPIRIVLTDEQKAQIKDAVGREAEAIELTPDELEGRTMPRKISPTSPSWGRI